MTREPPLYQPTPDLFRQVYDELRQLAGHYMKSERSNHTLRPTELVHEAFVKLAAQGHSLDRQGKTHFHAVAANAMRQILVDHARRRAAQKHGGNWLRVTLTPETAVQDGPDVDLIALDDAIQQLETLDARKCRVVELRFFGGLTCQEVAEHLSVSPKTAEADWYFARAWLRKRLSDNEV